MDLNEMINKSLDELDALSDEFTVSKSQEVKPEDAISKAQDDEDLSPDEVSDDAPQDNQDDAPEDNAPEDSDNDGDNDVDGEDTDNDSEGEEDSTEDDMDKSLAGDLKSNENVRKALEVSEFLDTLVKSLSEHIALHNDGLSKSLEATNQSQEILAKSLLGITKSQRAVLEGQASLQKSIRTLNKRLKAIEEQPMVRKSVQSAQPINKSFEASAGNKPKPQTLSKSQISAKLMQAFEGGNKDLLNDVLAFDSTGKVETLSTEAKNVLGL